MPNVCREYHIPGEIHWGTDAQCLQGMPYSPVKFIEAQDAQCLQGIPYSPVKFTGAQMPNVCRECRIPR